MIRVQNLARFYGLQATVKGVSFEVKEGEVVGLLGPNGAGKSTILKILSGQLWPSSGEAQINGVNVVERPEEAKRYLGYLPEVPPLYEVLEVQEYLKFVGRARDLYGKTLDTRLSWVRERLKLEPVWHRPIEELSRGFRQRVGLAQALLADPPVLILDEPTTGLDPLQILEIRALVRDLAPGKAILFSTHILQEAESLADRLLILNEGRIIAQGTLEELFQRYGGRDLETIFVSLVKEDRT